MMPPENQLSSTAMPSGTPSPPVRLVDEFALPLLTQPDTLEDHFQAPSPPPQPVTHGGPNGSGTVEDECSASNLRAEGQPEVTPTGNRSATAVPSGTPTPPNSLAEDGFDPLLLAQSEASLVEAETASQLSDSLCSISNIQASGVQVHTMDKRWTLEDLADVALGDQNNCARPLSEGALPSESSFQGLSPPPQPRTHRRPGESGAAPDDARSISCSRAPIFTTHTMDGQWRSEEKRNESCTDCDTEIHPANIAPDDQITITDYVKELIQTVIKRIQTTANLRRETLWEQFFSPDTEDESVSQLQEALLQVAEVERILQARRISYRPTDESWDDATSATSIAESTQPDKPSGKTVPLRAPFSTSYTIDGPLADTPVKLIEQFAEQLAKSLGGYIDRRLASSPASSEDNISDQAGKSVAVLAPKLEYEHVDEMWDDKTGAYKIMKSSHSKIDKLDEYMFVVRQRTDMKTQKTTTYLDIKSPVLRDILRETCCNIRGISLADNKPSIERNAMFHVREELLQYQQRIVHEVGENTAEKQLALFLQYLETAFKPIDDRLAVLFANEEITYDLLWALFPPNTEIYTTCPGTEVPRCVLFNHLEERTDMSGSKFIRLETRYRGSHGKSLGEVTTSSTIPIFPGANRIEHLPAFPLRHHPDSDRMRAKLVECGRKFVSLLGIHQRQYKGRAFSFDEKGIIVACHIEGHIMVDSDCFHENMPNHPGARVQQVQRQYSVLGPCDVLKPVDVDQSELKPEDFLICSPTVLGFSLAKKVFLEFAVAYISDVQWSEYSFKDVKMPEQKAKAIYALTKTYLSREDSDGFQDLVRGKGCGVNFLLYGPPGVGKTLTAETLAETFRAPLYTVAAGQIGVEHTRVEKYLQNIFKIASRWKAILLLDEADVFLADRKTDPNVNALVSVFLRELERYDGILFLTTNRMQTFDYAILSRIHLAIKYEELNKDARKAIWHTFLEQAKTKAGEAIQEDHVIDHLAEKNLNGREIRNAVLIAQSMAAFEETAVDQTHLIQAAETREELHEDFRGVGAVQNLQSYF